MRWAFLVVVAACGEPAPPDVLEPRDDEPLVLRNPDSCRECHPDHVADWEGSMHAYAVVDPVFQALNRVKTLDHAGEAADFCTQCHTLPGFLAGETTVTLGDDGIWRQNTTDLSAVAKRGVSCDVCHSITSVVTPNNVGYAFQLDGTVRGPFGDGVPTEFHAQAESPLHRTGEVCIGCHNVLIPDGNEGALVERTGAEWQEFIAGGGTESCQDCHMPARTGRAATEGPEREVHAHTFVGVDLALIDDFPDQERQRALVEDMLASAVDLVAEPIAGGVRVSLTNRAGHAVPSGVASERDMWLAVRVVDAAGAEVASDVTWRFGARLLADGNETLFPHLADGIEEAMLPPHGMASRDFSFALPPGTYGIEVELLFRAFKPEFLQALEEHEIGALDPSVRARVPVMTMASGYVEVTL